MSVHYDDLDINRDIRLDLPLRDGVGIITQDVAKPHHLVNLVGAPAWTILDSYLQVLTLDGTEYLQSINAETTDLEPTSGDYSVGGWFYWQAGDDSQILIGRYLVNVGGWELYTYDAPPYNLTLRHHHSLYTPPGETNPRTASYSPGWVKNAWHFVGISRPGGEDALFYRGTPPGDLSILVTTSSNVGLHDPEATTQDLVIGARYTKNDNFHTGMWWRWRYWGDRALTQADWGRIYERELRWFLS